MTAVATGGTWPRDRRVQQKPGVCSPLCQRCRQARETPFHRVWACPENRGSLAYEKSEEFVPEAYSQWESAECFWLRGLLPSSWVEAPPPVMSDDWRCSGTFSELAKGVAGQGSQEHPLHFFGDASGGPESACLRLRRVGVGLVLAAEPAANDEFRTLAIVEGPLSGHRQ
eukprot:18549-Pyramimonas_sp.AAC.1